MDACKDVTLLMVPMKQEVEDGFTIPRNRRWSAHRRRWATAASSTGGQSNGHVDVLRNEVLLRLHLILCTERN